MRGGRLLVCGAVEGDPVWSPAPGRKSPALCALPGPDASSDPPLTADQPPTPAAS